MELQKTLSYAKAYVEILEIINYMGEEYKKKIPTKLLNYFEENKDSNYVYQLEKHKDKDIQIFSTETIGLLSMIEYKYWTKDNEKELLTNALIENEKKYQGYINEKYNPDKIFNKNSIKTNLSDDKSEDIVKNKGEMIEYKESFFHKIRNWFKNLFSKNK